ncbi:MAG: uL4 family ribosomal protein [archaeon]
MKATVLNLKGEKVGEIELPKCFSSQIREDIMLRYYELSKKHQPYAPFYMAGMQYSASGLLKHARRKWKTTYGYGISRVPRKVMSRSGTRFTWVGATVSSTRGGRQSHPPKVAEMIKVKKINSKERISALCSAISCTASNDIMTRYGVDKKASLPIVVDSLENAKTKDIVSILSKFVKEVKNRKVLIVTASKEEIKQKIFESVKAKKLSISDLYGGGNPGRVTIYTQKAIAELKEMK